MFLDLVEKGREEGETEQNRWEIRGSEGEGGKGGGRGERREG